MRARTVGELIASCYTISLDEYLKIYTDPLLIGVGILDSRLLQQRDHRHSTLALSLTPAEGDDNLTRHHLMGYLISITDPKGESWVRLALGRTAENDIVIDDPAVSEFHGYVKRRDEDYVLGDLGSTNGTKVNGRPLKAPQTHVLRDEDIITFGRCSFQYFTPVALYDYLSLGPA
jgi:hypothetical protein